MTVGVRFIHRAAVVAAALAAVGVVSAQAVDEARVKRIVGGVCFVCHGMNGESSTEQFPRLAGQHAEYTLKQLRNFKSGARKSTAMAGMVASLTDAEMKAVAEYYAKQTIQAEPPKDPALAAVGRYIYHNGNRFSGVPSCASCHGPDALGAPGLPRLASQNAPYTEAQLRQFSKRERNNDNAVMHTIVEKMTPLEIAAVAEYLSGK